MEEGVHRVAGAGCGRCGFHHPWRKCPAFGKQCVICKEYNHFAKVCSLNPKNQRCNEQSSVRTHEMSHSHEPMRKQNSCFNCGGQHRQGECPALGQRCSACNKLNHFSSVCISNQVRCNEQSSVRTHEMSHSHEPMRKQNSCFNCGGQHRQGECPALGQRCSACNKLNHFSSVCISNQVRCNEQSSVRTHEMSHSHEPMRKQNSCFNCGGQHRQGECPALGQRCSACNKLNHFSSVCISNQVRCNEQSSVRTHEMSHSHEPMRKQNSCFNCGGQHRQGECPALGQRCSACNKLNHFSSVCISNQVRCNEQSSVRTHEMSHSHEPMRKQNSCFNCGGQHRQGECPALGQRCSACNKLNHFSSVCISNQVLSSDGNDDESEAVFQATNELSTMNDENISDISSDSNRMDSDYTDGSDSGNTHVKKESTSPRKEPDGCYYCGFKHKKGHCPAYGQKCSTCKKMNHFAQMCSSKFQREVENVSNHPSGSLQRNFNRTNENQTTGAVPKNNNQSNGAMPKNNNQSNGAVSKYYNQSNGEVPKYYNQSNGAVPKYYNQSNGEVPKYYNQSNGAVPKYYNQSNGAVPKYYNQPNGEVPKQHNSVNAVSNNYLQTNSALAKQNNQVNRVMKNKQVDVSKCFLDLCTLKHDRVIKLQICEHTFFRNCLAKTILKCGQGAMKCPALQSCSYIIPQAAIQSILTPEEYESYQSSEEKFQCRSPGCNIWFRYRKESTYFQCPSCSEVNCLICKSIHFGGPCGKKTGTVKKVTDADKKVYPKLLNLYELNVVYCEEKFKCPICLEDYGPMEGIILKECLHKFCSDCLRNTVILCDDAEIKCPFRDTYSCGSFLTENEIRGILTLPEYEKRLERTLLLAESKSINSFHCKTPNCKGWCEAEGGAKEFACPLCLKTSCLICGIIHTNNETCEQYQQSLFNDMTNNEIDGMIARGDAMRCPHCGVLITKISGCDGLKCLYCKIDICWVTKNRRWGPNGPGDTSGGCRCNINGRKCHPNCGFCH